MISGGEAEKVSLCRVLEGKNLFGALYGICWLALVELEATVQHSAVKKTSLAAPAAPDEGEFREHGRLKRVNPSEAKMLGSAKKKKKQSVSTKS